jgi:hypothetical protein
MMARRRRVGVASAALSLGALLTAANAPAML